MKRNISLNRFLLPTLLIVIILFPAMTAFASGNNQNTFVVNDPDYKQSPYTGMTRQHWLDAASYLLEGAFGYISNLDDPMKFPKQHDKTYPQNEKQVPTEKLEGLCRTLFVAAPLLRENPDLIINNIKVADYYRNQILKLITPGCPEFIEHRKTNSPHQNLVEFGALAISLSVIPDIIWEPFTKEQKDALAATMLSYGDGPTVNSNWRFFNIYILSFFKDKGYTVNEGLLVENLEKALAFYRGQGWYNDSPAYDYYSMWAFQMYGPLWAQLYGNRFYPEYAKQFMANLSDMAGNYPYMFNKDGKMNMWGRSIPYRFGSVAPFLLTGFLNNQEINYGWLRRISSATILQFLQHPLFLEDGVPTLGFYGPFAPATQIYSCRGSVYWCGKPFFLLSVLPENNPFWNAKENNGPWEKELKKNYVYNKFQEGSNLLITDYPNIGGAEMRSWCHETVAADWQKFRSSENYNKLAYHTEFPWMADGKDGEISMNYAVKNASGEWEVLRLYTFKDFENGIYRRDAVLETNNEVKFQLADIPLPDGVLRVDKVTVPDETEIRLGHYALPYLNNGPVHHQEYHKNFKSMQTIRNGIHRLALVALEGWTATEIRHPEGLHPESNKCAVMVSADKLKGEKIYVTLHLWNADDNKKFNPDKFNPIQEVNISDDNKSVEVILKNKEIKTVYFD